MRNIAFSSFLICACLSGCPAEKPSKGTELTLRRPQEYAITVSGVSLIGTAVWGVAVGSGTAQSDWLQIGGKVDGTAPSTSSLREVDLDVPLNLAGIWDGTNLHIAYAYTKYSQAPSLGVARLFQASTKSWQQATVPGIGQAPAQVAVDDDAGPPSPPNGVVPTDYIDSEARYVVRGVDLNYSSLTRRMVGMILLQADNGQLPEEFDPVLDLVVEVEGVVSAFDCRSTSVEFVQDSEVRVLRPKETLDSICRARFNLDPPQWDEFSWAGADWN